MSGDNFLLNAESSLISGGDVDPDSLHVMLITVDCSADEVAVGRLCHVLSILHQLDFENHELEDLTSRLPDWLCTKFSKSLSTPELEEWLKKWRAANPAQKRFMEEQKGWTADNWLYWMDPCVRPSYLLGVTKTGEASWQLLFGSVEMAGLNQSMTWLLNSCQFEIQASSKA